MIKKLLCLIRLFFSKQNQNTSTIITKSFSNSAKWFCFVLFLIVVNLASGQIALRGSATTVTTNNNPLTIAKPNGLSIGDIMIAQIMQSGNGNSGSIGTDANNTNWTKIAGSNIRSFFLSNSRVTLLYKISTATDVAAANFSFTLDGDSDEAAGAIIAFSGVDNTNPFDVTPSAVYTNLNDYDDTLNASAITTTSANSAILMLGAVHNNYTFSNWTMTSPGNLTELYDVPYNATIDIGIGAAWRIKTTAGSTGAGSASISNDAYNGSILIALRRALPTITGFGTTSACAGGTITINGTNLIGATAANVKIGGTPVSSITSNTATQIVAVIGSGTTGTVEVTSSAGTVTSAATFTVNPQPTAANAGPDQSTGSGSFTLAANTPTVGTGVWSIANGPSMLLSQFSSTSSPNATFTPAVSGTYVLNWAISNSCGSFNDQVVVANNCVNNMVSNSDFSNGSTGWTFATTYGDRVETNSENTYFSNGSSSITAELDSEASLRQVMTVIPGVSYTVSFRYARRDNAVTPATTGVTVKITGGTTDFISTGFTTSSTTSQIGTYTFTPTSSSIGVEFYNTIHAGSTLGTIIDDITLVPTSQVTPSAITSPRGEYNTVAACAGIPVQLDVENVPASGITYSWTGSAGAVFSSTTIKNPTVTFTGSGVKQVSVTTTTAAGCSGSSITYVNVTAAPTITGPAASSICSGGTYSSGAITSTGTTFSWSRAAVANINGGAAGAGGTNIAKATGFTEVLTNSTASPINVTYILTPGPPSSGCAGVPYNLVVTVNPTVGINITGPVASSICSGSTYSSGAITSTGTTYDWSRTGVANINGGAAGAGGINIAKAAGFSEVLTNSTSSAINVTYVLTPKLASGCSGTPYNLVVTVNPTAGITITAPTASFVCSGSTYSSGAIISTGTTFDWSRAAVANINGGTAGAGGTNIAKAAGFSEVLTNSTSSAINVTYVLTPKSASGCSGTPYDLVVTVNPIPTVPTVGTTTHISCITNSGSVLLNNLPNGNWTITSSPATVSTTGSGTSTTISGLAAGNYTFRVTNTNGCTSSATSSVEILDYTSTSWNGSAWSNGNPDATKNIIIASVTPSSPFTADLHGCALTIDTGVVATVSSGVTLTITNSVTTNGQLIFENNSSLVQINNVNNIGDITYKRTSFPMKNFDATYWSSPVSGQTLIGLSPNTLADKYIGYYDSAWKTEPRGNVMKPGIGYGIRVPKPNFWPDPSAATYAQPVEFKGVPNNGNIVSSQAMTSGKYYLIGNPYPSALDARAFLFGNTNNNKVLNGTIYFWTHNTAITPSGGVYVYSSNDYASFNATGGTATTGTNEAIPTGYIAAGQSFMASAKANGIVEFNNSMRVGGSNNSQFFKPGKSSKSSELEKHRLWLNMTNSGGAFKQTLIGYIDGATNSYDVDFDGETFDGNSYIDFYSINETDKLTIQGRALPFTDTDLVPLGYRSKIAGDFTISINNADGDLAAQKIYLEDTQTGTINELTAGNYTFATKAGTFNDRFVLRYSNGTLGTGDFETVEDAVSVVIQNKTVTVNSAVENIEKVFIYDITGKLLYQKESVNNLQAIIENLSFAQQVILVKVVLDNGYQTTKKVIFK